MYHVMVRGINQSQLFYDDEDRQAFLSRLERYKRSCDFELYAWSLMGNHAHLLIRVGSAPLADIMKRILLSYSSRFNEKYDRQGYLFQDRYKSKPINDDSYLLGALRYIHRNPLEIGEALSYWTSFDDYVHGGGLTDTTWVLSLFSDDKAEAIAAFRRFVEGQDGDRAPYPEPFQRKRLTDREAAEIICAASGVDQCQHFANLPREQIDACIPKIRKAGVSIRQLARLTGLGRGVVQRIGTGNPQR